MIRSGTTRGWLEKARRHLSALQGRPLSSGPPRLLEMVTEELHRTSNKMKDLMVM